MENPIVHGSITEMCENFITNREILLKSRLGADNNIIAVCACALSSANITADADRIKYCNKLIRENTGLFSSFKGNIRLPAITCLLMCGDPDGKLMRALEIYSVLKNHFSGCEYLAYAAVILADLIKRDEADPVAERGQVLYKLMKKQHPMLTSSDDYIFSILLALSEKGNDELIADTEESYGILRSVFRSSNSVQAASHILTLSEDGAAAASHRLIEIYDELKKRGRKYGRSYELASLAALAALKTDPSVVADEILEADAFLSSQSGYGFFGFGKTARLMHAVMIVTGRYSSDIRCSAASVNATLIMLAVQDATTLA